MANSLASSNSSLVTGAQPSESLCSLSSTDFVGSVHLNSIRKPTKINGFKCLYQTPVITIPKQKPPQSPPSQWNLLQRAAGSVLDKVENAMLAKSEQQQSLPKTVDPSVQISGNFAPVPERAVEYNLLVSGVIPDCIRGVYARNGANPFHKPVAGHHLFDGDGMVHAVNLNGILNKASYACRFTETQRLIQERDLGRSVFPKAIGELHGYSGVARLFLFYSRCLFRLVDQSKGMGLANAGLIYFNNRLLAMSEDDIPYHIGIRPSGDLETIGRYDFDGQMKGSMIAHPKVDPVTGDLFALSYDVIQKPYLKYFNVSSDGTKSPDVEIPLNEPTMTHDFAITENYVVIPDQQVVFKLQEMLNGGSPLIYDKNKKSRFGILLKKATDAEDIIWIESPDTFCFHLWNAWEEPETDEIVVIGSCMTPPDSIFNECDESLKSILSEFRLNLKTGKSRKRAILQSSEGEINLEVGMVNKNLLGRKTRFCYLAIVEPWPKVSGFAKVDLLSGDVVKHMYGDGRFGGEPCFVSRNSITDENEDEDDGYVIAFVHDEKKWKSELHIVNGKSMKMESTIMLPSRVPYGFHGTFISSKELENQFLI